MEIHQLRGSSFFEISLQFNIDLKNAKKKKKKKKKQEKFFVFEIIACELVVLNCLYYADSAFYWQSMGEQTV